MRRNPALVAEIVAAGHGIGLHCDRHRNLLRLTPWQVREDIARAQDTIAAGHRPRHQALPPALRGAQRRRAEARARRGWRTLLWSHWGRDWEARATPESIAARVTDGRRRGRGAAAARRRRLLGRRAPGGARRRRCRGCSRRSPRAACSPRRRRRRVTALEVTCPRGPLDAADNDRELVSRGLDRHGGTPRRAVPRRSRRSPRLARAARVRIALVGRGAGDRVAVLGVRRDHQPRAAAPARRARPRPRRAAPRAVAAPRPGARAGPLAGGPPHARAGRSPTTTTTPTSSSPSALLGWLWWARADLYRPLRNTLVLVNVLAFIVFWLLPGRPAADARRASPTWSRPPARSAPGTPARWPRRPTSWRRCPRCTSPGRCGARWRCGRSHERALGARAGGAVPVPDRPRGARHGQPLRARPARRARWRSRSRALVIVRRVAGRSRGAGAERARRRAVAVDRRCRETPYRMSQTCYEVRRPGRLRAPPQTVEGRFDGSAATERADFRVCRVALHRCQTSTPAKSQPACPRGRRSRRSRTGRRGASRSARACPLRHRRSPLGHRLSGAARRRPPSCAESATGDPALPRRRARPARCVPVALALGAPALGYAIGAGAWLVQRIIAHARQALDQRHARAPDPARAEPVRGVRADLAAGGRDRRSPGWSAATPTA